MFPLTHSSSSSSSSSSYTYLIIIRRFFFIIIIFLGSNLFQFSTMENGYDTCGYDISGDDNYFSCRDGVNLTYPFWSMDDKEDQQRQFYCGYPGLGITCSNGKPMINISLHSYYVIDFIEGSFTPEPNLITIVDPDFVKNTCPRPLSNFTIEQSFSGILRENSNHYLTFFFNCTSAPPHLTPLTDDLNNQPQDLECLAYYDMRSYGFLGNNLTESDWKLLAIWNENYCREQSLVVPVADDTSGDATGADDYLKALERGIRVEWNTPKECQRCENTGGFCSYNETESTYICWCKEGELIKDAKEYNGEYYKEYYYCAPQLKDTLGADTVVKADTSLMHNKILLIGVYCGFGGVALTVILLLFIIYRNNQNKRLGSIAKNVELFLESYGFRSLQRYKYKDIKKMTNSFKDKLGQGGYGSVFKGKLVDGRPVAVKVLINDPKKKTNGEDFMNEVATIGRTNHVNIVGLLGFCSSGSKRALVYEFMANGSLEKFIYAEKENNINTSSSSNEVHVHPLGWEKLYQIAIGIARGLEYLHRGCNTGRILHFDIKPHNILLDENFCPKISDFGLAKLCPTRESIVSMLSGGRGTIGYIAPEVYNRNFGGVSYKSDVYSYGMMVLEMVGGRKNIDPFVENTSEIYFPHWIYNHLEKDHDKIKDLLKFEEASDEEMAKKMIMVGLWCIQTYQESRPTMGRVAEMLEGSIKDLQMPSNPFVDLSLHPPPTS